MLHCTCQMGLHVNLRFFLVVSLIWSCATSFPSSPVRKYSVPDMPVQRRRQNIRLSTPEPSEEDLKRLEAMLGGGSEMRNFLEATGSPQIAKALKPTKQKIKSSVALLDDATPVDQQPAQELDDLNITK